MSKPYNACADGVTTQFINPNFNPNNAYFIDFFGAEVINEQ